MEITSHREGALESYHLAAHDVELVVIPTLGAKIGSIRVAGQEILARNPRPDVRRASYAAPYTELDAWGFDECLPTVAPCPYPEFPWQGVETPDHGEVWSIPWTARVEGGRLRLSTHSVRFAYEFHKQVALPAPGRISLDYALTSHAPLPFRYIWSSHPLVAARPGMRLYLPAGVDVLVDWSKGERLGAPGTMHTWPDTLDGAGNTADLSLVLPRDVDLADKLYTTRLDQGWCALHDPASRRYVAMVFSPAEIPYVGVWINQGGWPVGKPGHYDLGLEPCRGFPDRLDRAVERGASQTLQPGETHQWRLDLCVGSTSDLPAELERLRATRAL